jgi:hypothetical protein
MEAQVDERAVAADLGLNPEVEGVLALLNLYPPSTGAA